MNKIDKLNYDELSIYKLRTENAYDGILEILIDTREVINQLIENQNEIIDILEKKKQIVRPEWNEFYSNVKGYILCSCGSTLQTQQETREHWQLGHFDRISND